MDDGDVHARRGFEEARREDHQEIDRQGTEVDVAQARDPRGDLAAEDVDRQRVADADVEALRDLGVEAEQLLPPVVGRPPLSGDHLVAIGRASCRESMCQYAWVSVVAVSLNKKK